MAGVKTELLLNLQVCSFYVPLVNCGMYEYANSGGWEGTRLCNLKLQPLSSSSRPKLS